MFAAGTAFVAKPAPVNNSSTTMSINNINIYEAHTISGNAVTCSGINDNSATNATVSMPLATPGTAVMTITVASAGGALYLPGIMSGAGPVTYGGPGHKLLSGTGSNTLTGITSLGQGTLHIWGTQAASPINVTSGTLVLANDCVVNNVTLGGSGSILSCNETLASKSMHGTCANLVIATSSRFLLITRGAAANAYSNISASSVNLTGAMLVVDTSAYKPVASSVMTIIHNAGGLTGTFAGLPQGAIVTSSTNVSTTFTISYTGGAGHDVVLTARSGNGAGTVGGTSTGWATGTTGAGSASGGTYEKPKGHSYGFGGGALAMLLAAGLLAARRKV